MFGIVYNSWLVVLSFVYLLIFVDNHHVWNIALKFTYFLIWCSEKLLFTHTFAIYQILMSLLFSHYKKYNSWNLYLKNKVSNY